MNLDDLITNYQRIEVQTGDESWYTDVEDFKDTSKLDKMNISTKKDGQLLQIEKIKICNPLNKNIELNINSKYLFINFKRFKYIDVNTSQKLNYDIDLPEKYDFPSSSGKNSYSLIAFNVHTGESFNGGHYIAYININNQ